MLLRLCKDIAGMVIQVLTNIKTYSELIAIPTYEERFRYLKLDGVIGEETFGFDRYLNQLFYNSDAWKSRRNEIIIRDNGCDMAMNDYEIQGRIYIHHMNPIAITDIVTQSDFLLNPEYLVCVAFRTHQAIHYGDESLLVTTPIERKPNDTCPWRH